ncbi:MAG TPA: hypothetical protein VKR31_06325 [Rhizomicrobium sp.]|nr:hypothetical protein [Rhizomicrobium sp.]
MSPSERSWRLLGWLLLVLLVFSYPLRYVQQVALGQVVVYTGLLRLGLFAVIFAYAIVIAARGAARDQFPILVVGYVLISLLIYNLLVANFGVFYAAFGINLFVVPPAIAVIFFLNAGYFPVHDDASERRLVRRLLVVAIPVTLFGILQYWANDTFLQSGYSTLPRSEFGTAGQAVVRLTELASTRAIRANSIFDSALDFGHFAALFALLCFGMAIKYRQQPSRALTYGLLAGLFVVGVVSTNTRNMLLYLACCFGGCLLIFAGLGIRALVAASLAFVALFYATIYGVIATAPQFFAGFFDPVSLFQRSRGVYVTVQQFVVNADSLLHALFGFGYMQSTDFTFLPTTIFDNTELDIYLYAGICGLALFVAMALVLFGFAVRQWRETGRVAWLTLASLLMGLPLFSTINIDLDQPWFQFVFSLLVGGAAMTQTRSTSPAQRTLPAIGEPIGAGAP